MKAYKTFNLFSLKSLKNSLLHSSRIMYSPKVLFGTTELNKSNYNLYKENEEKLNLENNKNKKNDKGKKEKKDEKNPNLDLITSKTPKQDFFKKTERIDPSEERLNEIELRPYFEGLVDKRELSYDTFTQPTNIEKRLTTFAISKKEMIKRATRVKRVKIIRDHVKRQLDDKTL